MGRIHALWTLDGLEATDKQVLLKAMEDEDPQVRKAAIWISEPFIKKNDGEVIDKLEKLKGDESYDVRTQLLLSLNYAKSDKAKDIVRNILEKNSKNEMFTAVQNSILKNEEVKKLGIKLGSLDLADRKMVLEGANIFRSLCSSCHGADGKGLPSKIAPPLVGDFGRLIRQKDTTIMVLLHGLTGPVDSKTYPIDMPSMGSNNDQWIASVLSYLRYDLGITNRSSSPIPPEYLSRILVKPDEVKKLRAQTAGRNTPWTIAELEKRGK